MACKRMSCFSLTVSAARMRVKNDRNISIILWKSHNFRISDSSAISLRGDSNLFCAGVVVVGCSLAVRASAVVLPSCLSLR